MANTPCYPFNHPLATKKTMYPGGVRTFGPEKPWEPPAPIEEVIVICFGRLQPVALRASVYCTAKLVNEGFTWATMEIIEMNDEWTEVSLLADDYKAMYLFEDLRRIHERIPSINQLKPPYIVKRVIRIIDITKEQIQKGSKWRVTAEAEYAKYWEEHVELAKKLEKEIQYDKEFWDSLLSEWQEDYLTDSQE